MDQAAPRGVATLGIATLGVSTRSPGEADTIFAVASGAGRAAVAVLRISGPATGPLLTMLCHRRPERRMASLRTLRSSTGEVLDRGLVLWFPGPASYTGEDCAELHLHGSRAVLGAVAEALVGLGARPAQPGEFTRRAFLHGRMDLLEAEGVADLVEAETEAQRRQALRQLDGALGEIYRGWSDRLRDALALQEALIDFSDEEVPTSTADEIVRLAGAVGEEIASHLADGHRGERVREGITVAIVGAPNVGKSSLINVLTGRSVAIVSPVAGTTRDAVEARIDLAGIPVTLVDTAGLRDSDDPIEMEGVRRARERIAKSDIVIEIIDASAPTEFALPDAIQVANKADLAIGPSGPIVVSALSGAGLDTLQDALASRISGLIRQSGPPPLTRERHRASLAAALAQLEAMASMSWPELRAEHLRRALRSIGEITGEVGVEAVLDAIFGRFCIGK